VSGPLDAAVCDQIISESHGNPLALLELPRTWRATDLAGGFGLPGSQLIASKIQQSYVRCLRLLPSDTQMLVLAAAAEPIGDRLLLHRAAETLDIDMAAAFPAVDAGLLHVGWRVEFAHPLVRSATYRAATAGDRRRAHLALAEARTARRTRIGAPGIAPELRRARTKRSPPSSSARPGGHKLAEGSLPPPPFSTAQPN
jgi:hypothetical protein